MPEPNKKIYAGFIVYGKSTARYLPYFLPSLKSQTLGDFEILAADNSEAGENENFEYLNSNFPEIEILSAGKNLGFARAFNLMINRAISAGADYFLALNPDMLLESDMLSEVVKVMEQTENCAAVQPKILKWDFINRQKTRLIDSLGLAISPEHRFFDLSQGRADNGEIKNPDEVFGFTGAAALLNLKALQDVAYDNGARKEYFDELMFMYKEDCDLSYRLRLAGWKIILAPSAAVYHDRSAAAIGRGDLQIARNRKNKARPVKQWSFLNQQILLAKLKNLPFSRRVKAATAWYKFKSLVYVAIFEPYLLKELLIFKRLKNEIKKRRDQLVARTGIRDIEKFMREA